MAKLKRTVLGAVYKSKDAEKANYIQVNKKLSGPVTLTPGQYISVESKKFQLASLEKAASAGKISGDALEKARERINNIPDFVLGELVILSE